MNIIKIGSSVAAVALVGVSLAACSSVPKDTATDSDTSNAITAEENYDTALPADWESDYREGVRWGFEGATQADTDLACEGFTMMGMTTPEDIADFMQTAGDDGALIDSAFSDVGGTDGVESLLPDDVTINDLMVIAGEEIVDVCNL
jgi:hypothetical protein